VREPLITHQLSPSGEAGNVDGHDAQRIVTTIGGTVGLFFVEDPARARDDHGRKIIAVQDFVSPTVWHRRALRAPRSGFEVTKGRRQGAPAMAALLTPQA